MESKSGGAHSAIWGPVLHMTLSDTLSTWTATKTDIEKKERRKNLQSYGSRLTQEPGGNNLYHSHAETKVHKFRAM